ncbi:hypothetical protein EJ110_NYTH51038 [Nymphaea thermarum]|nr:hypothetical protein EJ110_NYTH51038 [Nymphaea thermarum]
MPPRMGWGANTWYLLIFMRMAHSGPHERGDELGVFRNLDEILFVHGFPAYSHLLPFVEESMHVVCEVKEVGSMKFYRLDDLKVLAWLCRKVGHLKSTLPTLNEMYSLRDEKDTLMDAVSLLGEYLKDDPWLKQLCEHLSTKRLPCMEGNNGSSGFNSYFQARGDGPPATGGIFGSPASNSNNPNVSSSSSFTEDPSFVFPPHSVGGRTTAATTTTITIAPGVARRKRGRPRKYGPGADGSVKPTAGVPLPPSGVDSKKKPGSQKAAQMAVLGNSGQGFTPHVVWVAVGEVSVPFNILFFYFRMSFLNVLSQIFSLLENVSVLNIFVL